MRRAISESERWCLPFQTNPSAATVTSCTLSRHSRTSRVPALILFAAGGGLWPDGTICLMACSSFLCVAGSSPPQALSRSACATAFVISPRRMNFGSGMPFSSSQRALSASRLRPPKQAISASTSSLVGRAIGSGRVLGAAARLGGILDAVDRLALGVLVLGEPVALLAQTGQRRAGGVREPAGRLDRRAALALHQGDDLRLLGARSRQAGLRGLRRLLLRTATLRLRRRLFFTGALLRDPDD